MTYPATRDSRRTWGTSFSLRSLKKQTRQILTDIEMPQQNNGGQSSTTQMKPGGKMDKTWLLKLNLTVSPRGPGNPGKPGFPGKPLKIENMMKLSNP